MIFLKSDKCMKAIKNSQSQCELYYEETKFRLGFTPSPQIKGKPYTLVIKGANIKSAQAELIGLSMQMPESYFKFSQDSSESWRTQISPGLCKETKMRWRLKLTLTTVKAQTYYTFIDYEVGI